MHAIRDGYHTAPLRLAVSGVDLDEEDGPDALVAAAGAAGATAVELWHPMNTSAAGVDRTLDVISGAGLDFICVTSQIELYSPGHSEHAQRELLKTIELAARAGAPFVNAYFGFAPQRDDVQAVKEYVRALEPCLARAGELGVVILLENEFNAFGWDPCQSDLSRDPERLVAVFEAVDSRSFGMTFDPTNFAFAGIEPYPHAYELLANVIRYVHVKNGYALGPNQPPLTGWRRFTDYDNAYTTCSLERGIVDWPALLARLQSDGYDGYLCIEPHGERAGLFDACAEAAAYVRAQTRIENEDECARRTENPSER